MFKLIQQNYIKTYTRILIERYKLLHKRERLAVLYLLGLTLIFIIYLLLWMPYEWKKEQKLQYDLQTKTQQWIKKNDYLLVKQKSTLRKPNVSTENSSIILKAARENQITITNIQPDNKGLSIWINQVEYQNSIKWLLELKNQFNITVSQIRINYIQKPGQVKMFVYFIL